MTMGRLVVVREEPTDAMLDAVLDKMGQRVEPYTSPRESGVPIDCDIDEATADYCNVAAKEGFALVYAAMISASPDLTDEEIDGLCRMMWPEAAYWRTDWRDFYDPRILKPEVEQWRNFDRIRIRSFLAALTSLKDNNHG
jgi:hypothetical protein